jgi:hypothetical protein
MSTPPPWGQEPDPSATPPPPPPQAPYQPYGAPGPVPSPYGAQSPPAQTNPLAVGSLIVSICSAVFCCGLPGIAGAIMGHIARKQIREQPGQTGEGLALGGIIVGWIAFGISIVLVVLYVVLIVIFGVWAESVTDCYYDEEGIYVCD